MAPHASLAGTEDRRARRLTAEDIAARALLEAHRIDEAAPKILEGICQAFGWEHGALWTIDRNADVLRCTEIWTSSSASFPEFVATSRQATFIKGTGLPGRVWATGEPAWIPDVVTDRNFPRAEVAAREGLHAAFGFPVLLRGEVLSVMEFFSREVREPDESLLAMLRTVGSQIGMFIDRRRAQDELDRFFTLSVDMLCVAGFDGYFKRVNPAWKRTLGYDEHELLTRPYIELIHPDDRPATMKAAERVSLGHELLHFENRYLHKDGTLRWVLWTAAPFPEEKIIYAAGRDITEQKAADDTLADQAARLTQLVKELEGAKRRAEDATATKSAFLANMSHEIRTPLNAILGMTTLALGTKLSIEQQDYLATVKSSAESLLDIVNDILDFSKIEAKRLDLDYAEFDLRETVGDAAKLLALRAAEKGLELACEITPDVPATLLGDAGRLRQILLNVIGNAVKFTNEGEVVLRVRTEEEGEDDAEPGRPVLHFTVTDTGIGIPKAKLDHIFEAFTQADSSTTRRFGGTGLGLAIALRLVELMGGRMWVESEVDRGSTFHFTAPFDRPSGPEVASLFPEPTTLEGLRVLVVDDNATNRQILEKMLASWHMNPTAVESAGQAMTALKEAQGGDHAFQVVITDGQMPEVDGFALTRRIKRDPDLKRTPVVMLSSVGHPADTAASRRRGVDAYLTKPVKHSDLLDALATLFGGSVRRRAETGAASPSRVPRRQLRILVAEDHPVNRKLVTTLLDKRGHTVHAVDNGRSAVDALAAVTKRSFDVVIMDVQMPGMSGFEAATAIRERERQTGGHVPIVALTAHAMQGDRERCLQAGMDGYLSKPIDVDRLIATVEEFGEGVTEHRPEQPAVQDDAAVFDEPAALSHTGGDRKLLKQIIELFRADSPASFRKIERALKRRDGEALWTAAHAIKGSMATIGAQAARRAAADIERLGRTNQFGDAARAYVAMRQQVSRLNQTLITTGLIAKPRRSRSTARRQTRRRAKK